MVSADRKLWAAAEAGERALVRAAPGAGRDAARARAARKSAEYSYRESGPREGATDVGAAVHLAGWMKLTEAAPLLQAMERVPQFGTSVTASEMAMSPGGIHLAIDRAELTRRQTRLALRRMGLSRARLPVGEVM